MIKIIVAILINPVFWISVLGPLIQSVNYVWLRSKIGIPYNADSAPTGLEELRVTMNDNTWAYALNDFYTQIFVSIMSLIFVSIQTIKVYFEPLYQFTGEKVNSVFFSDSFTSFIYLFFLLFLLGSIYICLSGKLVSVEILRLYKPEKITGENRIPPIKSPLSLFRLIIIIYSLCFAIWSSTTLPSLVSKLNQTVQTTPSTITK